MNASNHSMQSLFQQLGLSSNPVSMEAFIKNNHLPKDIPLERAACWSAKQAEFLQEAIDLNAEWADAVDDLNTQLHH